MMSDEMTSGTVDADRPVRSKLTNPHLDEARDEHGCPVSRLA